MDRPLVAAGVLLFVVGAALLVAAGDEIALTAAGMAALGCGAVLAVAYGFLLVGRSEDRERRRSRSR